MPKVEETKYNLVPRSQGGSVQYPGRWSPATLSSPLPVEISSSFTEISDIENAMQSWNDAHNDVNFFQLPASTVTNKSSTTLSDFKDGTLGIYKSFAWFSNISSETIAITQFYGYLRNEGTSNAYVDLTHADIIVNYRDHSFSTSPNSFEFDLQTVILHELGHFIGLKHPTDYYVPAVMQATLSPGDQKQILYAYDESAVNNNYSSGYTSSLTHFQNAGADRGRDDDAPEVSGYYELRKDGRCLHFQDGKFVGAHKH